MMRLLDRDLLVKTGPVDHADWNFSFLLGVVQRLRFRLALKLLPQRSQRLLEIGYGSGVFMPSLALRADRLFGVDIHPRPNEVMEALEKAGVSAALQQSGAEELPYADETFDSVVVISALEFVTDLDQVCREVRRVLKPRGLFVVVTPGHSVLTDLGLRILTGKSAQKEFGNRREIIIPTLAEHFVVKKKLTAPPVLGYLLPLYVALRLAKRS